MTRCIRTTVTLLATALMLIAAAVSAAAQVEGPPADPQPSPVVAPMAVASPASLWQARPLQIGLQATFVTLQAADVVTTLQAVHRSGAREGNPMMAPFVEHPAAFVAVKSMTTLMVIGATHRLSKTHPRRACLVMVGLNAAYAAVAASNYRQIARARR